MSESVTTTSWITTLSTAISAPPSVSIAAPSSCRTHRSPSQVHSTTFELENETVADERRLLGVGIPS
jgi:hypothetical protein